MVASPVFRGRMPVRRAARPRRFPRGIVAILSLILLPVLCAFVAFGVDSGLIALTQTRLQNAADAAALAASQEITGAIQQAAQGNGTIADVNSIAEANARAMAVRVAAANGVYVDPDRDVTFGKRAYDAATQSWPIQWGASPYNVVRVATRRDNADTSARDGQVRLAFGGFVGSPTVSLSASASAFVEARDIIVVLDYSSSMNDDSQLKAIGTLGRTAVENNIRDIFNALGPPDVGAMAFAPAYPTVRTTASGQPGIDVAFRVTAIDVAATQNLTYIKLGFRDGSSQTLSGASGTSKTCAGTGGNSGKEITQCWIKAGAMGTSRNIQDTTTNVKRAFGLDQVAYPYPAGSWDGFINYCRTNSSVRGAGYYKMYGGLTLVDYLLENQEQHASTPDLWKTPHYPFKSLKDGCSLFLQFLKDLDFGDQVGIVSYSTTAREETTLNEDGYNIDSSADPITSDYDSLDAVQKHRQAGHYSSTTGMGDAVKAARQMLADHMRYGARPIILVMTDGLANEHPSSFTRLPAGWDWDKLTDYDGDGHADYDTTDINKQYAFSEAKTAIDRGFTVHTLSVGAEADTDMMKALGFAGKGVNINVPGNQTIDAMHQDLLDAFSQIAGKVPPPKLIYDDGTPRP